MSYLIFELKSLYGCKIIKTKKRGAGKMAKDENLIESIVSLVNQHFSMDITVDQENFPHIQSAKLKDDDAANFINDMLKTIEKRKTTGALMYYYDNEIDFDTPEEYHRY